MGAAVGPDCSSVLTALVLVSAVLSRRALLEKLILPSLSCSSLPRPEGERLPRVPVTLSRPEEEDDKDVNQREVTAALAAAAAREAVREEYLHSYRGKQYTKNE